MCTVITRTNAHTHSHTHTLDGLMEHAATFFKSTSIVVTFALNSDTHSRFYGLLMEETRQR